MLNSTALSTCVVTVCLALGTSAAVAQTDPIAAAKAAFERGEIHYQVGEFDRAIAEYREAYRLSKAANLLFNIAQAFRLKGDAEQAIYFYRSFLRNKPDAENRIDVEARIQEMEQKRANERRRAEQERKRQAALAAAAKPRTVIVREPAPDSGSRTLKLSGIITGAAGIVAIGGGVVFAFKADSGWDDINGLAANGGQWSDGFEAKYDTAQRDETVAVALLATGGAALVAGGVLYYLGRGDSRAERGPAVTVAPTAGGAQVVLTWR